MIRGDIWRWWTVYLGTTHSVSWSGVNSGDDWVCIKELDTLYHDQGCSMKVMECVSTNKTLCIMIRGVLWRWWSVYPGTRNTVSWSGVISGGDGVCMQELDTLYHAQGRGVLWRRWSVYQGTRHSVSWARVFYGGDVVCIQELHTLYHDQGCSMEVMDCVFRN